MYKEYLCEVGTSVFAKLYAPASAPASLRASPPVEIEARADMRQPERRCTDE